VCRSSCCWNAPSRYWRSNPTNTDHARQRLALITIGFTDILFALDPIPAIYGLTLEPYIVFTANAFALMGLRQLYFLIGGLLDWLVYLSFGLAVILAFIGVS
jgi:predicted tellurium resistance membrane protein TerC